MNPVADALHTAAKSRRTRIPILLLAACVSVLPSFMKVSIYRWFFGYTIGRSVRIGFGTLLFDIGCCDIGDHVRIGCFNAFISITNLTIGNCTQIGTLNLLRGGDAIRIGDYATIMRLNVLNAIIEPEVVNVPCSQLDIGVGAVVTTSHWIDFTDQVKIGAHAILGGRSSSLWTHNRNRTRGITIGSHCYLGSDVRIAPGAAIPAYCIVAIGAVFLGRNSFPERSLIGGNPAGVLRPLGERDWELVTRKTRSDMPDRIAVALIPEDIRAMVSESTALDH